MQRFAARKGGFQFEGSENYFQMRTYAYFGGMIIETFADCDEIMQFLLSVYSPCQILNEVRTELNRPPLFIPLPCPWRGKLNCTEFGRVISIKFKHDE